MNVLKVHRISDSIKIPEIKTKQSACFDIEYSNIGKTTYNGFTSSNKPFTRSLISGLFIGPNERVQVPTGLYFDIPVGYSVRIHSRSSVAYTLGLTMVNSEGIIDSDYVDEIFLLLHNVTDNGCTINPGQRLAQGELVKLEPVILEDAAERPGIKTDRVGGIGSTGSGGSATKTYEQIEAEKAKIKKKLRQDDEPKVDNI